MKIAVASRGMPHQRQWAEWLTEGARVLGYKPIQIEAGAHTDCKVVACWGWRIGQLYRSQGRDVLVAERGYIGDRFNWTSLAWNGLNGHGDHRVGPAVTGQRFADNFADLMQPWQTDGDYALLLGQVPGDMSLAGVDYGGWLNGVAERYARDGIPLRFRPHPQPRGDDVTVPGVETIGGTLQEALAGAICAIAYNSNSLVDAALAGVPVWAWDKGSMAWPLSGKGMAVDRGRWAARLAWCQWSHAEICDGTALRSVMGAIADAA